MDLNSHAVTIRSLAKSTDVDTLTLDFMGNQPLFSAFGG